MDLLLDIIGAAVDRAGVRHRSRWHPSWQSGPSHTTPGIDPATALSAVLVWSRLHGIVSLEIAGTSHPWASSPTGFFEIQLNHL